MDVIMNTFKCCISRGKESPEREAEPNSLDNEKLNKTQIELIKKKKKELSKMSKYH